MEVDEPSSIVGPSSSIVEPSSSSKSNKKARRGRKPKPAAIQKLHRFEFAELNIQHQGDQTKTLQMVRRAIQMGYDTVVIAIDVGQMSPSVSSKGEREEPPIKKKKATKKADEELQFNQIPDPFLVDESQIDVSQIESNGKKFRQFSRLTVTLNDTISVHRLQNHPKRSLYDIVAIRCPDEQMLSTMSRKGELFDIITMDSKQLHSGKIPWIHKQKLIQACMGEGISFEVCYGEALQDNDLRRQFFINGRALALISNKGRGIVLSSGTGVPALLRGPYDVANMCVLFGMKPRHGNKLVSDNCCKLLLRSQTRRTIKGVMHIAPVDEAPTPASIRREDHLAALEAIPEFRAQMKSKFELSETT